MICTLTALLLALPAGRDTTITLGRVERDLTGDGRPEVLRLVGTGKTIDSLDVVLIIESRGSTVYRSRLAPLTRRIGFDVDRRLRSRAEQREYLAQFGGWFLGKEKFLNPGAFIASWKSRGPGPLDEVHENIARDGGFYPDSARARAIWIEMQQAPITIFVFSAGGDAITALGWSSRAGRFYRLIECC